MAIVAFAHVLLELTDFGITRCDSEEAFSVKTLRIRVEVARGEPEDQRWRSFILRADRSLIFLITVDDLIEFGQCLAIDVWAAFEFPIDYIDSNGFR